MVNGVNCGFVPRKGEFGLRLNLVGTVSRSGLTGFRDVGGTGGIVTNSYNNSVMGLAVNSIRRTWAA